jgi:hypothetical protein
VETGSLHLALSSRAELRPVAWVAGDEGGEEEPIPVPCEVICHTTKKQDRGQGACRPGSRPKSPIGFLWTPWALVSLLVREELAGLSAPLWP